MEMGRPKQSRESRRRIWGLPARTMSGWLRFVPILIGTPLAMTIAIGCQAQDTVKVYRSLEDALLNKEDVHILDLSRQTFEVLPSSIALLTNLEDLRLRHCRKLKLENAFEVLAPLEQLRKLDLSWSRLYELPKNISKLEHLEELDLSQNNFLQFPKTFSKLERLRKLSLRNNRYYSLESFFEELAKMPQLEELDVSYCGMEILGDELGQVRSLKVLDISGNDLVTLPESFSGLVNLRVLYLEKNFRYGAYSGPPIQRQTDNPTVIKGIGPEGSFEVSTFNQPDLFRLLSQLPSLEVLSLNDCHLGSLDESVGKLSHLKELYLNRNYLTTLPGAVGSLSQLEVLDASNVEMDRRTNRISSIPESIGRLSNLRMLNLRGNQLTEVTWDGNANLEHLDLSWNRLAEFPAFLNGTPKLKYLDLSVNLITEVPVWISELKSLEELRVDGDFFLDPKYKISALPDQLTQLSRLRLLSLEDQVIVQLPESFGQLAALEELHIRGNLLSQLPSSITQLKALRVLDLKGNEIKELPTGMSGMTSLRELNLSFNIYMYAYTECSKLQGTHLESLDISFTQPLTLPQLEQIREWLPGTDVAYAFIRK